MQNLKSCAISVDFIDSCSSTFVGRKSKRTIETTTTAALITTVTIPPTTSNDTTMTDSTEEDTSTKTAPKNDKTLSQDEYSHVELCEGLYKTDFCLNNGTCFIHRYREAQIYVCDCPSHYVGQRCEEKQLEGSYGGGMKLRIRRSYRRTDKKIRRRRISRMFNFVYCCFCLVVGFVSRIAFFLLLCNSLASLFS